MHIYLSTVLTVPACGAGDSKLFVVTKLVPFLRRRPAASAVRGGPFAVLLASALAPLGPLFLSLLLRRGHTVAIGVCLFLRLRVGVRFAGCRTPGQPRGPLEVCLAIWSSVPLGAPPS